MTDLRPALVDELGRLARRVVELRTKLDEAQRRDREGSEVDVMALIAMRACYIDALEGYFQVNERMRGRK